MITGSAIATLVVFILSITCVILPFHIPFSRSRPDGKGIRFPIDLKTAPIIAIAVLWAAQCLGPAVIRNGIVGTEGIKPYNILILFFSLAYMTITLDVTGVLQAAAFWVSNKGGSNGYKLYFYFYIMLTLLSVVVGNDPVILSGTVFLVYYTKAVHLDPLAWLIAEFAAANTASMVLFVGNPTNVVICEGFRINNVAYSAYTVFPFMACIVCCFLALAFQFRDKKHVPKKLEITGTLSPRSVLLDPVSAWVGSILLGSCLAVILVVSFFGVDVWMISLPFAFAKFIFDIAWDYWRYEHGMIPSAVVDEPKDPDEVIKRVLERTITHNTLPSSYPTFSSVAPPPSSTIMSKSLLRRQESKLGRINDSLERRFPTFFTALPRLPFALVPFAFSQFILIEALAHQGWIDIFALWLVRATGRSIYPTVWIVGVLGVLMCNVAGTNIGATILLTKVVRSAPDFPHSSSLAAAIALAVASNVGAVSFTFSASLAGLLWRGILEQKGITIKQRQFAFWNLLPILVMTVVGLAVVSIEMAVLFR